MRIGVLTGGGDCPGLNAVIRALVRKGEVAYRDDFVGFLDGWKGVVEDRTMSLNVERCRGLLPRGGTILGTSRTTPYKIEGGVAAALNTLRAERVDALVAIGGEDTLGVASKLAAEGVSVVGVPKTIDNDLSATEVTFGFHTAVQIAVEAIDRLHTTAESHDRVIVCEVMGRHAGWIATYAGIAGGAAGDPRPLEEPFDIDEVCRNLKARHAKGRFAPIVVVAEGALPVEGTISIASFREVDQVRVIPASRRNRQPPGRRDRAADRLRDQGDHPRSRSARRYAHRLRSGPGHSIRGGRNPARGSRPGFRGDGGPSQAGEIVRVPLTDALEGVEDRRRASSPRGRRHLLGVALVDFPPDIGT